jgi:predicted double-glycine peptidase
LSRLITGRSSRLATLRRPLSGFMPRSAERGGRCTALVVQVALLATASPFLAWKAWGRWGPVPERPVPPGAEVRQWSPATCGPAAVATLLNVYGRSWSRATLERQCGVSAAGTSLEHLAHACQAHGLQAEGLRATAPRGLRRVPRPFIGYVSGGHFVVIERLKGGLFEVFDPASGARRSWSPEELHESGQGYVLSAAAAAGAPRE